MATFFTSDQHFGHRNIIQYCARPFRDVYEMTEGLVERHNSVVRDGDEVYHVGDFALNEKHVLRVLSRLRGKHYLVCGNHDACHPMHKRHERAARNYMLWGFAGISTQLRIPPFDVCHMPYLVDPRHAASADGAAQRYAQWRPKDEGRVLLHGHIHSPPWERVRERQIDVGVDANDYTPVAFERLFEIAAPWLG